MTTDASLPLVPRVRFPDFRDDGPWERKPLSDLSERVTETVGELKLTPVSISAGRGFVPQAEKFGRDISGKQYSMYIRLRRGEFAYNRGNSKQFPQGCVYQLTELDEAAASNAFYCFRLHEGLEPRFFAGFFESNAHGRQLLGHITSSARGTGLLNIRADAFFGITIPIPKTAAEQKRVADCLGSLDDLIAAKRRRLEFLRQHKQGLMQLLIPPDASSQPRVRFPQFIAGVPWRSELLEALAERGTGHTPRKSEPGYYDGGINWVSLADSGRLDSGLLDHTEKEISQDGLDNSSAVLHPPGTVILSRDAGVGKSAILGGPMAVSQHFVVWHCDDSVLHNWFLYYLLQRLKPEFERVATGSTVKTIGMPFFRELRVGVPETVEEQYLIANCLRSADEAIAAQAGWLSVLERHKRGLLQQLFPAPQDGGP